MPTARKPVKKLKVVKSDPERSRYTVPLNAAQYFGSLPELRTDNINAIRREMWGETDEVQEPTATYGRTQSRKRPTKHPKRKGYDARKYSGMIPGIAERMKEYLKTMRDDR